MAIASLIIAEFSFKRTENVLLSYMMHFNDYITYHPFLCFYQCSFNMYMYVSDFCSSAFELIETNVSGIVCTYFNLFYFQFWDLFLISTWDQLAVGYRQMGKWHINKHYRSVYGVAKSLYYYTILDTCFYVLLSRSILQLFFI